jgi:TolB protein
MTRYLLVVSIAVLTTALTFGASQTPPPPGSAQSPAPQAPAPGQPPAPPTPTQSQSEISLIISADASAPPRYAVPDFIALSSDAETAAVAKTIGQVLWEDLEFEREFYMIPRDTYRTIPASSSVSDVAFDRWRELGADGLLIGTVQKSGNALRIEVRLYNVRTRQSVFAKEYAGGTGNPRLYAHTIADEVHQQQRGLRGVARTKLTFSSDRDGDRVVGTVEKREVKEIYISDYDGANQRRITVNRSLNVFPVWTPDGRGILYTSFLRGYPDLVLSLIYEGVRQEPAAKHKSDANGGRPQNRLGVVSPDGRRICFSSNRDGNPELYIMNLDGTNVFRLTNHPAADITPTWNPQGTQIAFTSDRRGPPQLYTIGADGTNLTALTSESYADRPTWSSLGTEIAYTARTGPGFDIKVIDLATRQVRQLTFGEGSNESPAFAPNGRHLAFMSTRAGKSHIFTIARDGKDVRQITRTGNNTAPNWSQ